MCVLGVLWAYLFLMCVHASAQPKAKLTDSFPLWSPLVPLIDRHNAKVQALSLVPMLISFSCIFMSSLGFNQLNKGWDRWLGAALITDWLIRKRLRTSYNNHRFLNVTFLHHLCFLELMSIKLFFCRGKEISNLFSWCGNCKKKRGEVGIFIWSELFSSCSTAQTKPPSGTKWVIHILTHWWIMLFSHGLKTFSEVWLPDPFGPLKDSIN